MGGITELIAADIFTYRKKESTPAAFVFGVAQTDGPEMLRRD